MHTAPKWARTRTGATATCSYASHTYTWAGYTIVVPRHSPWCHMYGPGIAPHTYARLRQAKQAAYTHAGVAYTTTPAVTNKLVHGGLSARRGAQGGGFALAQLTPLGQQVWALVQAYTGSPAYRGTGMHGLYLKYRTSVSPGCMVPGKYNYATRTRSPGKPYPVTCPLRVAVLQDLLIDQGFIVSTRTTTSHCGRHTYIVLQVS